MNNKSLEERAREIVGKRFDGKTKEGKVIPFEIVSLTTMEYKSSLPISLVQDILAFAIEAREEGRREGLKVFYSYLDTQEKLKEMLLRKSKKEKS